MNKFNWPKYQTASIFLLSLLAAHSPIPPAYTTSLTQGRKEFWANYKIIAAIFQSRAFRLLPFFICIWKNRDLSNLCAFSQAIAIARVTSPKYRPGRADIMQLTISKSIEYYWMYRIILICFWKVAGVISDWKLTEGVKNYLSAVWRKMLKKLPWFNVSFEDKQRKEKPKLFTYQASSVLFQQASSSFSNRHFWTFNFANGG